MSPVGQPERTTQNRVIALFRDELNYQYLGHWADRAGNSNIEEEQLSAWLTRQGWSNARIGAALHRLHAEADQHGRGLCGNNQAVYGLLRYGVPVMTAAGQNTDTVRLINWQHPEDNDFAIAEEVTLRGGLERRPDLVLYVNGIAFAIIELKNSRVSVGEGIRQCLSNQQPEFNERFFSTVQFAFAGNDSRGPALWRHRHRGKILAEVEGGRGRQQPPEAGQIPAQALRQAPAAGADERLCAVRRRVKKLPRAHQYFGIKAAQEHVRQKKGGIIWHTQGSGKSIVMVLLAKWILESNPAARVAVITDRDELDKQIKQVFEAAGETIYHTGSGRDLMTQLAQPAPRLLCSLVHKFGRRDIDDLDAFIRQLEGRPSLAVGDVFVFVDECHRSQNGKLHRLMKAMMPNAVFIGFTGTPLLVQDRATSLEVFGGYIHTYKFSEAVDDEVAPHLRGARHRPAPGLDRQNRHLVRDQDQGIERLAEGRAAKAVGHHAERAQLARTHGPRGGRHRVRFQRETAAVKRTRQRHPGGLQHLRGLQVLHPLSKDALQGQMRGGDLLQPLCGRCDHRGNRRQHRDRQAVHLQHLCRTAPGRGTQSGQEQDRNIRRPEADAPPKVELGHARMRLRVRPGAGAAQRHEVVEGWYRQQLRDAALPLIARCERRLGVKCAGLFDQRKTRWGSCNSSASTIRLNTELARKPKDCLEYLIMHELAHLVEPTHNARFRVLMDKHMPDWKFRRQQLNRLPVRHADWDY